MDVFEIHIPCFTIADVVLVDKCVHGFEASSQINFIRSAQRLERWQKATLV